MVHICQHCNKEYKSSASRSNHIKKYHSNPPVTIVTSVTQNVTKNVTQEEIESNKHVCSKCDKSFKFRQGKWRHEQNCKEEKQNKNIIVEEIKKEYEIKLEETVIEMKKEMEKMKNIISTMEINPKTLNKNINKGTIINNNNYIIPLSQQNLTDVLSKSEKLIILNSGSSAHLKLTDMLFKKPEYEPYRNVYITNLANDIGYIYDDKDKRFIVKKKKDIIEDFGHERMSDIELFYQEMENKIPIAKLEKMKELVKNYFNDKNFKELKNKEMLITLYNNKINVKKIYDIMNQEKEIEI